MLLSLLDPVRLMRIVAARNLEQILHFYCTYKELICAQNRGSGKENATASVYVRVHTLVCAPALNICTSAGSADVIFLENEIDGFELLWSDLPFDLVKELV